MLLDDVKELPVAKWGPTVTSEVAKVVRAAAPQARCYVFDRDASFKLGQFIRSCPDVIADQLEFAIEPYPITYIEVEIDAVTDGIGRAASLAGLNADWKIGFLRSGTNVFVLVRSRQSPQVLLGMYGFGYLPEYLRVADPNPDLWDRAAVHMLGSTYNDLNEKQIRRFMDRYAQLYYGPKELEDIAVKEAMEGHMGEIRTYAAALLLLHQKKCIALTEKPAYRAISRGKSRPFMAHNVVTITLDGPIEIRRAMNAGTGETRRAHEVPAHYAHRYGTRNCEHIWSKRENEENHWDCSKCGRFRYLRRDHIRGDASKGFVKKSYNVVTERSK